MATLNSDTIDPLGVRSQTIPVSRSRTASLFMFVNTMNRVSAGSVWSHAGIVCTGETYKSVVKMTFAKGAALKDPSGLFNSSLEGNVRRAIDIHERDKIEVPALTDLIPAAVALNLGATCFFNNGNNIADTQKVAHEICQSL